uniref:Putative secreted peptide n=1 Tax=Anopheles braziliensis TaxID=58242 RepID=A0A2M3ZQW0_9DIPT
MPVSKPTRHQVPLLCLLSISCWAGWVRNMSAEFSFGAIYHRTPDASRKPESAYRKHVFVRFCFRQTAFLDCR